MTERSVAARAAAALREAKRAFAANDYPLALARISQAVALNHLTLEVVELFDVLLGAADTDAAAALLGDLLDDTWGDWPPDFHASLAARRFEALRALPATGAEELAEAALETLEAAAAGDVRHGARSPIPTAGRHCFRRSPRRPMHCSPWNSSPTRRLLPGCVPTPSR
jgi:hypothetical protein